MGKLANNETECSSAVCHYGENNGRKNASRSPGDLVHKPTVDAIESAASCSHQTSSGPFSTFSGLSAPDEQIARLDIRLPKGSIQMDCAG